MQAWISNRSKIALKIVRRRADQRAMVVFLCMVLVPLLAAGAVALWIAIVTAQDGYEDEQGFHREEKPAETESVAYKIPPVTSAHMIRIRVRSSDVPLPLILSI